MAMGELQGVPRPGCGKALSSGSQSLRLKRMFSFMWELLRTFATTGWLSGLGKVESSIPQDPMGSRKAIILLFVNYVL